MAAPEKPLGFLLRTLDRLLEERFEEALQSQQLSRRQWQLLNILADGQKTLGRLDEAVAPFLDANAGETSERHLEPLVSAGLVAKEAGEYRLTDAGRAGLRSARASVDRLRARMVNGLDDGEYARTVRSLEAMIGNLAR